MDTGLTRLLLENMAGLGMLFVLGWLLARAGWISHEAIGGFSRLLIDVTMPALFFVGALSLDLSSFEKWWPVIPAGFAVSLAGLGLAWLAHFKVAPVEPKKGVLLFLVSIGNSSFLPIPLCFALWGDAGVLACLFYILGNNFAVFSFGIGVFVRSAGKPMDLSLLKLTLLHPQPLAFAGGLALGFSGITLPAWTTDPLTMLGKATIPLAMIVVGAILSEVKWKERHDLRFLSVTVLLKLVALPGLVLLLLKSWEPAALVAGVILLQASMPSLASAGVYARRFGGDDKLAASGSLITTLLCPLTLPVWMSLL